MVDERPALARRDIPRWPSNVRAEFVMIVLPMLASETIIHVHLRPTTDARAISGAGG
jgi:hypothetical protein